MLSLGPGSACDVCLEPFGVELKAPCSIPCGHVFCVNCLQHIARPTCPLCRTPFEARNTIRLHIDLDNVRVPSSSTDKKPTSAGTDDGARQLQKRITGVATEGATEIQTTQLTAECRAFLETVPRNTYPELRTSFKMLSYMCHVKHLYINQGRTVDQLTRNTAALSQEVDLLNAALEALKIEKRRLEQSWQTLSTERDTLNSVCHSLREQLNDAETKLQLVTEQNATAQTHLVLLNDELRRLRSEDIFSPDGDVPTHSSPSFTESPESDPLTTPDPDSAVPFLSPLGQFTVGKALAGADLPEEDPVPMPMEPCSVWRGYCGAAGCPHSCDCVPFTLFSPGPKEAAAADHPTSSEEPSTSDFIAPVVPSGLSLRLNPDGAPSRSRSTSRPRSRSLSRSSSPTNLITSQSPSASPLPSLSASMTIPNAHYELRGQLKDLLCDPPMSSSLPNMSHFPSSPLSREFRYGTSSPMHPGASKDRPISTASAASPASSSLHPPSTGNSNSSPSPLPTSAPLSDPVSTSYPQRPSLLRSSSSAAEAADQAKRETEWRRADRAAALGLDTHRRASPRLAVDVRPGPTPRPPVPQASPTPAPTSQSPMRPQGHAAAPPPRQPNPINTSPQSPSDAPPMPRPQTQTQRHAAPPSPASPANSSFWPPPMQRPQTHAHASPLPSPLIPMTSSSQPSSHPQAMQRPQTRAHAAPLPAPTTPMGTSTHAQSLLHSHPMPRPQAHGGSVPSPTTPSHHQQQQVKPSSSSHTHKPAMYANPPSPSVALNNSTIYAAPASVSRQAPEGGQRARRPEVADAYAAVGSTRGTSKRMLSAASVAMTANTSVAGLYA